MKGSAKKQKKKPLRDSIWIQEKQKQNKKTDTFTGTLDSQIISKIQLLRLWR